MCQILTIRSIYFTKYEGNESLYNCAGSDMSNSEKQETAANSIEGEESSPSYSPLYAWYVVVVLMLFYVLSFLDRQIISIMIEPIKRDIGLNDVEISLLGGLSFALFYSTFGILIGRMADVVNRRNLIAMGVFVWSLTTAFCGMVTQYWQLLTFRMGVGLGESALLPSSLSLISSYFPKNKLGAATGVFLLGAPFGLGFAFAGGGKLYAYVEKSVNESGGVTLPLIGDVAAWQLVFLILGATGVLMTFLLFTIREPRSQAVKKAAKPKVSNAETIAYFKENARTIWGLFFGMSFVALASYAQGFWDLAFLHRSYGWQPTDASFSYGIVGQAIGGACGMLLGGYFVDRLRSKGDVTAPMKMIIVGMLVALPCGIIYPLMPSGEYAIGFIALTILGNSLPYTCAGAAVQLIFPANMRGLGAGIYFFISNVIGMGLGPTMVAFLTQEVFENEAMVNYSILSVGTLMRLSAIILIFITIKHFKATIERVEGSA